MKKSYSYITRFLLEFAEELGVEVLIEPEFGYAGRIKTKDGRVYYYHNKRLDINNFGASELAKDKAYAAFFMQQLGYPVPQGISFYSDDLCRVIKSEENTSAALRYAEELGFPVMVKPNSEGQGRGVEKVYTKEELLQAVSFVFEEIKDRVALVQSVVEGKDYRIVVLGDEVLCAYVRSPLSVTGDGRRTILQLLKEKQEYFVRRGRDTVINLDDPRLGRSLSHKRMEFAAVLPEGQKLQLLANANLSSGGEAEDVTFLLHQDYQEMAVRLTREMGLQFCGIDLMTASPIHEPMREYVILEINSAPGLDYYEESGEKQGEIVRDLYKKVFFRLVN